MKPMEFPGRGGLISLRLLIAGAICCLAAPFALFGAAPTWWSNPALTTSGTIPIISGTVPNDYAVANQGQVKNMAVTAVAAMNAGLPGGAGPTLNEFALQLTGTSAQSNDYAVANLGQLKSVAKPFYDRLLSLGLATHYPWIGSSTAPNDFAAANIGQVKNLFSFDPSSFPPLITSPDVATAVVDAPFTYGITATNSPTGYGATGLPSGLTVNGTTGIISGTATTVGTYDVALDAVNSSGTGTGILVVDVVESATAAPVINSPCLTLGNVDQPIAYQITATNNPISFAATSLPSGLSADPGTGVISGTISTSGTYVSDISATNGAGTGSMSLTIVINPPVATGPGIPIITGSLAASGSAGQPFSYSIVASNSPTSYGASYLPSGLSLNTSTGLISGTIPSGGTYQSLISAANSNGTTTALLTLSIAYGAPVITSGTAATGIVGTVFTYATLATNSPSGYTSTSLPAGLNFDASTGFISGIPTSSGTYSLTLTATNSLGTASLGLTVTILPGPIAFGPVPIITSTSIIYTAVGQPFTYDITASNAPTAFGATGLPAGLSIDTSTGIISGTATSVGTPGVILSATNAFGQGTALLTIVVASATANVTGTLAFQTGIGDSNTAGIAYDPGSGLEFYPTGSLQVGTGAWDDDATELDRFLLAFDFSGLPHLLPAGAVITNASLTLTEATSVLTGPLPVELHEASTSFDGWSASWDTNSSYDSTVLSTVDVSGTGGADTWTSTADFINAIQTSATSGGLYLMLVSPVAEASGSVENITYDDESASPSSSQPVINITYQYAFPPIITGSSILVLSGSSVTYPITSIYGGTGYSATGLPTGLSIDPSTGIISGSTTAAGDYQIVVTASNANGIGSATFNFNVGAPPVISGTLIASGTANSPFTPYTITASNSPTAYNAVSLPFGLTLDPVSGVISGTPGIDSAGTYAVALTTTNIFGSGTASLAISIASIIPVVYTRATPLELTENIPMAAYNVYANAQPTGFAIYNFPAGLSVNSSGVISGTPTVTGTFLGLETASNTAGTSSTAGLTVVVTPLPIPVVLIQSAAGVTGTNFHYAVQSSIATAPGSSNTSPTSYSAAGLPSGLAIGAGNGMITGTASVAGTYDVTVSAADASGTGSGIVVITLFSPSGPGISSDLLSYTKVGADYSYNLSTIVSDATATSASGLPAGLSFSDNGNYGVISGTATTSGTYDITVGAVDASGTSTATLVLYVAPASNDYTAVAQVGVPFSFAVADGAKPTNFQAADLPPGLTINAITGVISGTAVAADVLQVGLTITDANGTQTGTLFLTITADPSDSSLSFQDGVSPTSSYAVPSATVVNGTASGQTSGTGSVLCVGETTGTASNRSLLAFDLTALPANANITSAALVMTTSTGNSSGAPLTVDVYEAATSFSESTANWTNDSFYNDSVLGSIALNPSSLVTSATFIGTAAFTQAAQEALNYEGTLYLTLAAPGAEAGVTPDYVGFATRASSPVQNPQLILTYTVTTPVAPVITSPATLTGTVNSPVSYAITATNNPLSFSASGLPSGLSINTSSGLISGTVTSIGSTVVTVSATNAAGIGSKAVTFNIGGASPATGLTIIGGNDQVGSPGTYLTQPLVVEATSGTTPLANALVTFAATPGEGAPALSTSGSATACRVTAVTGSNGEAEVYFQLPQSILSTTVTASAGVSQPVSFAETSSLIDVSSSNDSLVVLSLLSGADQSGSSGQVLSTPFTVQASNANGQPLSSQSLSLAVISGSGAISSGSGGTFTSTLSLTTNALGRAVVYLRLGGTNGTLNQVSCAATSAFGLNATIQLYATTASGGSGGTGATGDPGGVGYPGPGYPGGADPGGGSAPSDDSDPTPISVQNVQITPNPYVSPDGDTLFGDIVGWTGLTGQAQSPTYDYRDITISWSSTSSVTSYKVYRSDTSGTTTVATTSGTSTTDSNLYSGIAYQYSVVAISGTLQSAPVSVSYSVPLVAAVAVQIAKVTDTTDILYPYSEEWVDMTWWQFVYDYNLDTAFTHFKYIFNPSETPGTYTWYYESGEDGDFTAESSPTNIPESSVYPHEFIADPIGGGVIGNSTIYSGTEGYYEVPFNGVAGLGVTVTVTYTQSAGSANPSFQVEDADGNPVVSGSSETQPNDNGGVTQFFEGTQVIPTASAKPGDTITITASATPAGNNSSLGTSSATYTYEPSPLTSDFSIPIDEASGSRYRKIALNGTPMPDEKPQQSAESDQEKEETYIDALTLGLVHSTTDVYLPIPGSDFSVSARRDFRSQVWNNRTGLRPHEQPDLPFGICWSSNLAPNIKFVQNSDPNTTQPPQAIVTDETGAIHTFFQWTDTSGNVQFFPMPTAKNEAQVPNLESLTSSGGDYTFKRKYGATLTYSMTTLSQKISNDRVLGSNYSTTYTYARLTQAADRLGNTVQYSFTGSTNLVPEIISVPNDPALNLYIEQTGTRISAIWDANGNKTTYNYTAATSDTAAYVLTSVVAPDGAATNYGYNSTTSPDATPVATGDPGSTYSYEDLASIEDPLGNTYSFSYALDQSKMNYTANANIYTGYYIESSSPRTVAMVTLPGGTATAQFINGSSIKLTSSSAGQYTVDGIRASIVIDAVGYTRNYLFSGATVVPLPSFPQPSDNYVESKIIVYTTMSILYPGVGIEIFQFDLDAGMALLSSTDLSGNTTGFTYNDAWSVPSTYQQIISGASINGFYNDPTSQINAMGHAKTFAYNSQRIMQSVTDEDGHTTAYDIDAKGRRTCERHYDASNTLLQQTHFAYGSTEHPGVVTKKTTKALGGSDPSWADDMVTSYTLDESGRVTHETVDPDGLNLTTTYTYDYNGNKLSSTDPKGNTTWFSYDSRNRLITTTFADGSQKQFTYDARGNKTAEYDENGNATLYQYDHFSRLAEQARDMNANGMIDPGTDLITSYTYNAVNSKLTSTTPNGATTFMEYDPIQRLISITDPMGGVTHYEYGANSGGNTFDSTSFKPTHTVDPRSYVTNTTYDKLYRPITKHATYEVGRPPASTSTTYDFVGNPTIVTDPLGHQTKTTYDGLNRPLVTTYADTTTTQNFYTSTGFKWKTIDENTNATQTVYDNASRPIEVIGAVVNNGHGTDLSPLTQTFYDAAGNILATLNPLGNQWDYVYDSRNRKVQELDPPVLDALTSTTVRPIHTWAYDSAGRVVATIDPNSNETDTYYDPANRVTDIYQPAVSLNGGPSSRPHTQTAYDADGNIVLLTDPNGNSTVNGYDSLDRLRFSTDAAHDTVVNGYDPDSNKTFVTDGKGQTTTFDYDGFKRNTSVIDAQGDTTRFTYDGMNKTQRTDTRGLAASYLYDTRNRLTNILYNSAAAWNSQRIYGYDFDGNLLSVSEPAKSGAADVAYTYDALNRVSTETSSGETHTYLYDLAGNRISATYGGTGLVLTSAYDTLNRLTSLTEESRVTLYGYDPDGNLVIQQLPNGDVVNTDFDALDRKTGIATAVTAGNLSQLDIDYDLKGNLTGQQEQYFTASLANRTLGMNYDGADRLAGEAITQGTLTLSTTYTYDGANNRCTRVVTGGTDAGTTSYAYSTLNQLTAWSGPGGSASYTYDSDGNRVTSSVGSASYGYDAENRLVSVAQSGTSYQYVYDYRTRRVQRTEGGSPTTIVYSGGTSIAEYAGGASLAVQYIRGSDWGGGVGGILYTLRGTGTAATMGVTHYDSRGDVVAKTDASGVLTYQASYKAFGKRSQEYGSTPDRQKANTKEEDPTGLLNEGLRYTCLDGGLRVFLTKDPTGMVDGPNLYTYVNQNPWTKFDPEGLSGNLTIATIADGTTEMGITTGRHSYIIYKQDNGGTTTYGTWGNNNGKQGVRGVNTDTELNNPAYTPTQTRTEHLTDDQEKKLKSYISDQMSEGTNAWTLHDPCSSFAANSWNAATGEKIDPRNGTTGTIITKSSSPQLLGDAIKNANGGKDNATVTPSTSAKQTSANTAAVTPATTPTTGNVAPTAPTQVTPTTPINATPAAQKNATPAAPQNGPPPTQTPSAPPP